MEVEDNDLSDGVITDSENDDDAISDDDQNTIIDSDDSRGIISDDEENVDDDQVGAAFDEMDKAFGLTIEAHAMDEPYVAEGHIQKWEKIIVELAKVLRCKGTYLSLIFSLKIANIETNSDSFPQNMKSFWKIVNRQMGKFQAKLVCSVCWDDGLGNKDKPTRDCACGNCGPTKRNENLASYLYLDLPSQLRGLLGKPGMATDLQYPYTRVKRNPDAIEDVYDGSEYRRLAQEGNFLHRRNRNFSFALWVDGVSPSDTSTVTIWPVFLQILELSPRGRQRNTLLAGIYVGPCKPHMSKFLIPITMQLRRLVLDGVSWRPNGGDRIRSRFMTLIVSADSDARYLIFGMTRFNGYNGCTFCYAVGERIGVDHRNHVYRPDENAADRTDPEIRADYLLLHNRQEFRNGIQTVSALTMIPFFDLRVGQLTEAMHCLWEGNFARFYRILTSPETENHITRRQLTTINHRITSIKCPTKLARKPRSMNDAAYFTATEHRNTAWYYWLPCAAEFMPGDRIQHFSLFAEASFILNKDSITPAELDRAEVLLDNYCRDFGNLYPETHMVYNFHLLKHLVRCVRELGPLWVASGFWFESLNRQVKNYLTSAKGRAWQVACRILLARMVEKYIPLLVTPSVQNLVREMMGKACWVDLPEVATGRFVRGHRGSIIQDIEAQEVLALQTAGFADVPEGHLTNRHWKICIDGVIYQIHTNRAAQYDDSIAYIDATNQRLPVQADFIRITSIVSWEYNGNQEGLFGFRFNTIEPAFGTSYMKVVQETQELMYVPINNVISPGVLVRSRGQLYISSLPNRWDID